METNDRMAENESTLTGKRPSLWSRFTGSISRHLMDNPIIRKELRGRMRGWRAFVVLTIYLLILACFISTLYYAYASAAETMYGPDSYLIGKVVFGGVLGAQMMLVIFITPAFTAGTISGERERQTYDLLRTTLLSAPTLVIGKLVSSLFYVVLLMLAAVPLESMAFLLGGVTPEEVIISQFILLATALALGAASVYISSRVKSTLAATVLSYAFAFFSTGGLPLFLAFLSPVIGFAGTSLFGATEPHWSLIALMIYVGGFLLSINPLATIILSELVLLEEQTAFFFKITLPTSGSPTRDIWLVSPWLVYVLFNTLLALLATWLSVRRVRRLEQ